MSDDPQPERWFIAPYFFVPDVVAAANYYRDTLGFQYGRLWGEPPAFCMVHRAGITIMLSQIEDPALVRPNSEGDREGGAWDAYIWDKDADMLYAEFVSKGATI